MTYAKVINSEIIENNRTLPFSTSETSFGINTSIETMREFGYLPIIGTEPTLTVNQKVNGVSYVVGADEVTKVYDIVVVTDEELFKATVPTQITKLQAMRAMKTVVTPSGTLWVDFNNALVTNADAMDEWNLSPVLLRSNVYVAQLALYLGITERQLDDLFILGTTL